MADVTIDGIIGQDGTPRGHRAEVWHPTDPDIGYRFYVDSDSDFSYSKTVDGGASWGAAVQIGPNDTDLAYDVWADWWTPGDTGTLIHCVWFGSTLDDVLYRTIDIGNSDALGTQRTVFSGASASTINSLGINVSITKAVGGNLYVSFDIDAFAEHGFRRSTDGGVNWSARSGVIESSDGWCQLLPAANTGDSQDVLAVYVDPSDLTVKWYDDSANTWTESSTIATVNPGTTALVVQYPFSASIRHSDGHLIIAVLTERDAATADHRVFDVDRTSGAFSITELTAITTNIDDNYYPSVFIDQGTDDIYVAYNGKSDGSETLGIETHIWYQKSTDDGATWGAAVQYSEGSGTAKLQTWAPLMGTRFHVSWRVGGTLLGNAVNSVTFAGGVGPIAIGQATEADTAQALGKAKTKALGQAAEAGSVGALVRVKSRTLGQASETSSAGALAKAKAKALGQATETDSAGAVSLADNSQTITLSAATEADTAQALGKSKSKAFGQAATLDTAGALGKEKAKALGQAVEESTAGALGRVKARALGQATEVGTAQALGKDKTKALAQASETDTAGALTRSGAPQVIQLGQATETNTARALTVVLPDVPEEEPVFIGKTPGGGGQRPIPPMVRKVPSLAKLLGRKLKIKRAPVERDKAHSLVVVKTRLEKEKEQARVSRVPVGRATEMDLARRVTPFVVRSRAVREREMLRLMSL